MVFDKNESVAVRNTSLHRRLLLFILLLLTAIAAENIGCGIALTDDDRDRLVVAAQRIRRAAEAVR